MTMYFTFDVLYISVLSLFFNSYIFILDINTQVSSLQIFV